MLRTHDTDPTVDSGGQGELAAIGPDGGWLERWKLQTRARRIAWSTAFLLVAAGALTLLTSLSQHAVVNNSDTSTVVLEGYAMLHGNLLLHNWSLSLDSFWSVDVPFYALGTLIVGLRPLLVNIVPAGIGLLTVIVGVVIARDGLRGRAAVIASATVAALLLLPSHALAFLFLQGPWHIATGLWCLLAFFGLRTGRFGWGWVAAVVFLAAGLLGDVQALAIGVLPAFIAGLVAVARARSWRSGLAPISAAIGSIALAEVIREISLYFGTFTFNESHHTVDAARMSQSVGHMVNWGAALFGVHAGPFGGPGVPGVVRLAHLLALIAILGCLGFTTVQLCRGIVLGPSRDADEASWRLDDLLILGLVGDLGVFELLTLSNNILYARYLTVAAIFAVVLTGRVLGRATVLLRKGRIYHLGALGGLMLIALFAAEVGIEIGAASPVQPAVALDNFLLSHHLRTGVGDYWAASVVTVQTDGAIEVRPVVANASSEIVPDARQAPSTWYSGTKFQFLVYQRDPFGRVGAATVSKTFGVPEKTWIIGQYRVAIWNHPIMVTGPAFP